MLQLALRDRLSGEVSLHLRLIASEVTQHEECAAQQSAPQVVPVIPVELCIHRVEFSHRPGEIDGIRETDSVGHERDHGQKRQNQAREDDRHLQDIGPRDGRDSAQRRVEHANDPDEQRSHPIVPAENDAHHDRRRIEREPDRRAALDQENDSGQRASDLGVEPPLRGIRTRCRRRPCERWGRRSPRGSPSRWEGRSRTARTACHRRRPDRWWR